MSHRTKQRREVRTRTTIDQRYTTDRHGPREEEEEGLRHKRIREYGAKILKYDVTMEGNGVL
jgi:hypothetical protein